MDCTSVREVILTRCCDQTSYIIHQQVSELNWAVSNYLVAIPGRHCNHTRWCRWVIGPQKSSRKEPSAGVGSPASARDRDDPDRWPDRRPAASVVPGCCPLSPHPMSDVSPSPCSRTLDHDTHLLSVRSGLAQPLSKWWYGSCCSLQPEPAAAVAAIVRCKNIRVQKAYVTQLLVVSALCEDVL